MPQLAPPPQPPSPSLTYDEGDHIRRLRFGMWRMTLITLTILCTAWACTYGWIPAIIALLIAKHVLVAILVMNLGVDSRRA